jgi:hypothetical protein
MDKIHDLIDILVAKFLNISTSVEMSGREDEGER